MRSTSGSGRCWLRVRLAGLVAQVCGAVWSGACARLIFFSLHVCSRPSGNFGGYLKLCTLRTSTSLGTSFSSWLGRRGCGDGHGSLLLCVAAEFRYWIALRGLMKKVFSFTALSATSCGGTWTQLSRKMISLLSRLRCIPTASLAYIGYLEVETAFTLTCGRMSLGAES